MGDRGPNLADYISRAVAELKAANVENPGLDAHLLAGHALSLDRAGILSQAQRSLAPAEVVAIQELIARRARREPVARILGEREFWSLPFGLNEATLEPRPDSETVVEAALEGIRKLGSEHQSLRILDLGTGTGCLLLALLHELLNATGLGVDIAPRAVEQAQKNAERLGLENRAVFRVNDWANDAAEKFDLIVSNPPYVARDDIATLMPEVRDHDPVAALDGGEDGLAVYRLLIPQLPRLLKPGGFVAFEIGAEQGDVVRNLFQRSGFGSIASHKDLGGIERCITATCPGS